MTSAALGDILGATIVFMIPLLLVAIGGMCSERSGIINLALEGIMIIGALVGSLLIRSMSYFNGELNIGPRFAPQGIVMIAIIGAGVAGLIFALLLAFASINLKADQTIGGTALNLFAPALSVVITWVFLGQGKTTMTNPSWLRMSAESFGLVDAGRSAAAQEGYTPIPSFLHNFVFKNLYLTTIVGIVLFVIVVILLYKTKFGLRLRACGEHPQAADSVGINVYKMRYAGVIISGFLAGVGGIAFTLASGGFSSSVAGYGFLGLAVMIFGNWKPFSILGAAAFFALFKVFGAYAGSISFIPKIPLNEADTYFWPVMPYIVTMILLVLTSKKSRAPKAEGIPYDKSTR